MKSNSISPRQGRRAKFLDYLPTVSSGWTTFTNKTQGIHLLLVSYSAQVRLSMRISLTCSKKHAHATYYTRNYIHNI